MFHYHNGALFGSFNGIVYKKILKTIFLYLNHGVIKRFILMILYSLICTANNRQPSCYKCIEKCESCCLV